MRSEWKLCSRCSDNSGWWVLIYVYVKNNATGQVIMRTTDAVLRDGEEDPDTWIWEEGNFNFDCNRELFFGVESEEPACGNGAYSINLQNPDTGKFYYQEFEMPNASESACQSRTPASCSPDKSQSH